MRTATSRPSPVRRVAALSVLVLSAGVGLTGCSQVVDAFNSFQAGSANAAPAVTPTSRASAPATALPFDSQFTYDGSVALTTEVAPDLELKLDVWAADPKRTREWTPDAEKTFGFAVNVLDGRVDEKAVLTQKRRVYISSVAITSQTAQTSGQVQQPFQFSADPRTLVPTDTLRSDRGLLLNTYQGGLLVPETTIRQLPRDTYGVTLTFAIAITVEQTANTDASFQQQTVYQYLPIAITLPEATAP